MFGLLIASTISGLPTDLEGIKLCLPEFSTHPHQILVKIDDKDALNSDNIKRPYRYFLVAAKAQEYEYLNLVGVTKGGKCINPSPGPMSHIEYGKVAPFEIAVELQSAEINFMQKQEEQLNKNVPPEIAELHDDLGADPTYQCQPITAVMAEALVRNGMKVSCPVLPKEVPSW